MQGPAQSSVCGSSSLCQCRQRHRHSSLAGALLILSLPSSCLPRPLAPRPHQGPPNPKPVWLCVSFFTNQITGPATLNISMCICKKTKQKNPNQATMRFCLNFAKWKPHRDTFSRSAFSSHPGKAALPSLEGSCFDEFMDQFSQNSSGRQGKVTLPFSWASSNQKYFGNDAKLWQKEDMKYFICF